MIDPDICNDDGPITPSECARWLDAKYRRHNELEDRAAALWLRKLETEAEQLRRELATIDQEFLHRVSYKRQRDELKDEVERLKELQLEQDTSIKALVAESDAAEKQIASMYSEGKRFEAENERLRAALLLAEKS